MGKKYKRSGLIGVLLCVLLMFALVACDPTQTDPTDPADPLAPAVTIERITVEGAKTEFGWDEDFSLGEEISVIAHYSDQSERHLSPDQYEVDSSAYIKGWWFDEYTIYIKYEDKTVSYTVEVKAPPVTSLVCSGAKTEFYWDEEFSLGEEISVIAYYSNQSGMDLGSDKYEVDSSEYIKDKAGEYTIYIKYEDKTVSYTVTVKEPPITSLVCSGAKTEFGWGEDFSYEGLVVTKILKDGSEIVCDPSEYTVSYSMYKKNEQGTYSIIIIHKDTIQFGIYKVTVGRPMPCGMEISGQKTSFFVGENFKVGNLVVTALIQDGSRSVLHDKFYTVDSSLFDKNTPGVYKITVHYREFSQVYDVEVVER